MSFPEEEDGVDGGGIKGEMVSMEEAPKVEMLMETMTEKVVMEDDQERQWSQQ